MIKVSFIMTNVFVVLAVCCMILFSVGIDRSLNRYIQGGSIDPSGFQRFMKIFGITTATFYAILVFVMSICYYYLNKTLKEYTHNSLVQLRNMIGRLFCVLLLSYIIRSLFLDFEGQYRNWIKSIWWRNEIQLIIWVILDIMTLVPILAMHYLNFTKIKEEPRARQSFGPSRLSVASDRRSTFTLPETKIRRESIDSVGEPDQQLNESVHYLEGESDLQES